MSTARLSENPWFLFFTISAGFSLGALVYDALPRAQHDADAVRSAASAPVPVSSPTSRGTTVRSPTAPDNAFSGNDEAAFKIASGYEKSGEYDRALPILLDLAERGHAGAQRVLGGMYTYGHGVSKQKEKGRAWLRQAAEHGDSTAQNNLGVQLCWDNESYEEYLEGLQWLLKASRGGDLVAKRNMAAELNIADHYYKGEERFSQDYTKAFRRYRAFAELGRPIAQYMLGIMYLEGQGVERNAKQGRKWLQMAADQKYPDAIDKLKSLP